MTDKMIPTPFMCFPAWDSTYKRYVSTHINFVDETPLVVATPVNNPDANAKGEDCCVVSTTGNKSFVFAVTAVEFIRQYRIFRDKFISSLSEYGQKSQDVVPIFSGTNSSPVDIVPVSKITDTESKIPVQ